MKKGPLNKDVEQARSSEARLISLALNGDEQATNELILNMQKIVYPMLYRQFADKTIVEELTQEICIKAYNALRKFRFESSLATWIRRITLNQTSNYFKSRAFKEWKRNTLMDSEIKNSELTPSAQLEGKQDLHLVLQAILELPASLRDVLTIVSLEGCSYEEASEILNVPIGTVRSRLNKARLLLKSCIGEA